MHAQPSPVPPSSTSASTSTSPVRSRSRLKRILLRGTLALVVVGVLLVAVAPMVLSGFVRSSIEEELRARVEGVVSVDEVALGWFSAQEIKGVSIKGISIKGVSIKGVSMPGGAEVGSLEVSSVVEQGLWALLTGSDIAVKIDGSAESRIDSEGRFTLLSAIKSTGATDPSPATSSDSTTAPAAGGSPLSPLGSRKVTLTIGSVDLLATAADGSTTALKNLHGSATLTGSTLALALDADALSHGNEGECSIDASAELAFDASGALDLQKTSASVDITATKLALPSAAGELVIDQLDVKGEKESSGECTLTAHATARVAAADETQVHVNVAASSLVDARGAFALDPALITAHVDVQRLPLAPFQPFAPQVTADTALDLVHDLGDTIDLRIEKAAGVGARIELDAQRVKLAFTGDVAADGSSIERGTLSASGSIRPELLRALGVETVTPLAVQLEGTSVEWKSAASDASALVPLGGEFRVDLASPFALSGLARGAATDLPQGIDVHADSLRASVAKRSGESNARGNLTATAKYGVAGFDESSSKSIATVDLQWDVDVAAMSVTHCGIGASVVLDSAVVEKLSAGAVRVGEKEAQLRLTVPRLSIAANAAEVGPTAVSAVVRVELAGALELRGNELPGLEQGDAASAVLNHLALDLVLPRDSTAGTVALGLRIDGANTRIGQTFDAIPAGFTDFDSLDFEALNLNGVVEIAGLDPSVIARMVPATASSIGALGRGPLTLKAFNSTVVSAPATALKPARAAALRAEFTLKAATIDATGSVQYAKDSIEATDLAVNATLNAEALASLPLGETLELEPGATVALQVERLALARVENAWLPQGDLSATAAIEALGITRAPGLHAPLSLRRVQLNAGYSFKDERASAKGSARVGSASDSCAVAFDLAWKRPADAKLFAGAEGSLALTEFNLAKFEAPLGLTPGVYSGVLGGSGSCTIAWNERAAAHAVVNAEFPKARAAFELDVVENAGGRVLTARGEGNAEIAADAFGRLAAIANDSSRRVKDPVHAALRIKSVTLPLDAAMKPQLADARVDLTGSLTPVVLEVTDASGARSTISTGALNLTLATERLADTLSLSLKTAPAASGAASTAAASTGSLNIDATIRGAVAAKADAVATPTLDARIEASKFPAATFDAFLGTKGAVAKYVGDTIDAKVTATSVTADRGELSASVHSPFASLEAPAVVVRDGFVHLRENTAIDATFSMSPAVRSELLASINPIFADVTAGSPAHFTLSSLAWPLSGDRRAFDAAFTLETGEVSLTNSGPLAFLLVAAGAGRTEGFEAYLEPLRGTIAKGRLTYRDFALRAGKSSSGTVTAAGSAWKNSLVFSGDIDLAATPMRANAITTAVPLSDASNWSRDAKSVFDSIGAASPELLKTLQVGVELSGPLFDATGKPAKLNSKLKLPDIGDVIRDDPGALIDAAGSIFDAIRGPKKPDKPKAPKDSKPKDSKAKDSKPKPSDPPAKPPATP